MLFLFETPDEWLGPAAAASSVQWCATITKGGFVQGLLAALYSAFPPADWGPLTAAQKLIDFGLPTAMAPLAPLHDCPGPLY